MRGPPQHLSVRYAEPDFTRPGFISSNLQSAVQQKLPLLPRKSIYAPACYPTSIASSAARLFILSRSRPAGRYPFENCAARGSRYGMYAHLFGRGEALSIRYLFFFFPSSITSAVFILSRIELNTSRRWLNGFVRQGTPFSGLIVGIESECGGGGGEL